VRNKKYDIFVSNPFYNRKDLPCEKQVSLLHINDIHRLASYEKRMKTGVKAPGQGVKPEIILLLLWQLRKMKSATV
jgi:hypothetical protein